MPQGVPTKGFRMTAKRRAIMNNAVYVPRKRGPRKNNKNSNNILSFSSHKTAKEFDKVASPLVETDAQIRERLREVFDVLDILTKATISGDARALIISGPPGVGKSFGVEKALTKYDPSGDRHTIIKGFVRVTGLYKTLYEHRHKGDIVVFDDADSIFGDAVALNMLKAVCDTTKERTVSYLAETNMVSEEEAVRIPRSFTFEGSIIFISNYNFDELIESKNRLEPHLSALISRAQYVNLTFKSTRDYLLRIEEVARGGMLAGAGLTPDMIEDVLRFINQYASRMRELSLRMAIKLAAIRKNPDWERVAKVTCLNK